MSLKPGIDGAYHNELRKCLDSDCAFPSEVMVGALVEWEKMTLTEGKERLCGLAATHPNFKRKHKYPENRKKKINPKADRQFGICALVK